MMTLWPICIMLRRVKIVVYQCNHTLIIRYINVIPKFIYYKKCNLFFPQSEEIGFVKFGDEVNYTEKVILI